jgi:S-adenosylmethionine synthetase
MARYIAKNIVAPGSRRNARSSRAIGVAQPSVLVDTFDTGSVTDELLGKLVRRLRADAAASSSR